MVERITTHMFTLPILALMTLGASAQEYTIAAGTITACSGVMHNSGGPGPYGDNENYTVVICPDQPGDGIFLTWAVWNLNGSGPNNNLDRIRIWDGNSTAGTFLGEYNSPPAGWCCCSNELQSIWMSYDPVHFEQCWNRSPTTHHVLHPFNRHWRQLP